MGKVTFPIEHAVALPDVHASPLGPAAPREITWDRAIDSDPDSVVTSTLDHYGMTASLSPRQVEDIVSLLLPERGISTLLLFSQMRDAEEELVVAYARADPHPRRSAPPAPGPGLRVRRHRQDNPRHPQG